MQSFGRRRSGIWLNREQIGDSVCGGRKLEVGRIDNFGDKRTAPSNLDRLRTMMCFLAARDSQGTGFGSTKILSARKFVAAVVDHVVR